MKFTEKGVIVLSRINPCPERLKGIYTFIQGKILCEGDSATYSLKPPCYDCPLSHLNFLRRN